MQYRDEDVVIVGGARTPVGSFLGGLKTVTEAKLGVIALEEALKRSGVAKEEVEEVIVGHVTGSQTSNNLGNIIGIDAGLPHTSTGMTINRICGSGFQSLVSAVQQIKLGDNEVVAAGGVESLSRAPFYLPIESRYQGLKMGNFKLIDANLAGHASASGTDSGVNHMGNTAENVVRHLNLSRESQDQFAYDSQMKAKNAIEKGYFAEEIVPVEVPGRKGQVTIVDQDEFPKPNTTLESLAKLKPVFEKDGTVTAGNASGLNDGGAFSIVTTASYAEKNNLTVWAKVLDYNISGVDPKIMGLGPVPAIKKLLERNHLDLQKDIGILEINEAFAAQQVGCLVELGIDMDSDWYKNQFNPQGGGVSLGHPLGMSGARITVSLLYQMKRHPEYKYVIGSACIGGGMGIAVLFENGFYQGA